MLNTIPYTLVFESPLLISSAATLPGIFDRITALDDEMPFVPASSIRGRVKDTIRWFLLDNTQQSDRFALCPGQAVPVGARGDLSYCSDDDLCALCRIFGAPGGLRRGFEFSGAHYSAEVVEMIRNAFDKADLTTISLSRRMRNQHDDTLRRAREDHLFTDGVAEILAELEGVVRETQAHLRVDDATRSFDYRLLLLGLRLTTELGASRNRGYGRCDFRPADELGWMQEIEAFITEWKAARGDIAS